MSDGDGNSMEDESPEEHRISTKASSTQTSVQTVDTMRQGVSGGNLHDSTAVGDNHGDVNSNHIHGNRDVHIHNNTIKVNVGDKIDYITRIMSKMAENDNSLSTGAKGSRNPTDVHPEKEYTQTPTHHPEDGHGSNNVSSIEGFVSGDLPKHSDQSNQSENIPILKRYSGVDGDLEVGKALTDLGVQIRDKVKLADINLHTERAPTSPEKTSEVSDLKPCFNAPAPGLHIYSIDLRKVKHWLRMKTSHNIEMTVKIAKIEKVELANIYNFLETLYFRVVGNCDSGVDTPNPGSSMVQPYISETNFDTVQIDLSGISCDLLQALAKYNVDKIVFLAEISPDKSEPISEFISRIYIRLALGRVAICSL